MQYREELKRFLREKGAISRETARYYYWVEEDQVICSPFNNTPRPSFCNTSEATNPYALHDTIDRCLFNEFLVWLRTEQAKKIKP